MSVIEPNLVSTLTPSDSPYFSAGAGLMVGLKWDVMRTATDFDRAQRALA